MEEIINIKFKKKKTRIKKPRLFLYSWVYNGSKFI